VTREMPDHVVWLPLNSVGGGVPSDLGALPGQVVRLARGAADSADSSEEVNA
jgi:NADH-quinone oxidoreductase subunit G